MRFTKLLAATMAAMAITSCSQQEVIEGSAIEPGDAQVVLDLGRSFTTYASEATENGIQNGTAKLYDAEGKSIVWKSGGTIDNTGKLIGVVDASIVNGLKDKKVKLLVTANSDDKSVTAGTAGTDLVKESASTSAFDLYTNQNLATGILSSGQFDLTLVSGPVTAPSPSTLKRTISRIYVKKAAGVTASINGYNIEINGLSKSVGVYSYAAAGATTGIIKHQVTETPENDSYDNTEVVGYAYPSAAANITISSGTTEAQISNYAFEANKNYALVVSPTVVDGAVVDINFTISSWETSADLELTMTDKVKFTDPGIPGVNLKDADFTFPAKGLGTTSDYVTMANLLGSSRFTLDNVSEIGAPINRSPITDFYSESTDGALRWEVKGADLLIAAMPNITGNEITYRMNAHSIVDGVAIIKPFTITVPAVTMPAYPAGFTTMFNGIEWMTINTQNTGKGQDDIDVFTKVNALQGSNIIDKLKAYSASSEANHDEISGGHVKFVNGQGQNALPPTCPEGFVVPSAEILRKTLLNIDSPWVERTEDLGRVTTFDVLASPTSGSLMKRNFYVHIGYGTTKKGYTIIEGDNSEQILMPWNGNLGATGIENTRIGAIISRTPAPTANSTQRFVLGVDDKVSYFIIQHTAVLRTNTGASNHLRCVKITPETYWDI